MDLTPDQFVAMCQFDRYTQILVALIERRVTAATVLTGSTKGSAANLIADANLIMAEIAK